MMWAFHTDDPSPGDESSIQYHTSSAKRRGSRSLNLLNYIKNSPLPKNTSYFDIMNNQVGLFYLLDILLQFNRFERALSLFCDILADAINLSKLFMFCSILVALTPRATVFFLFYEA